MMSNPDDLFKELTKDVDPRVKRSFNNIRAACDDIINAGGILNYSKVGKWCEQKFGVIDEEGAVIKMGQPTVKTIQQNRFNYKTYIDARKHHSPTKNRNSSRTSNKDDNKYPAPNLDSATKLHINNLRSEVNRLRRELSIVESRFNELQKEHPIELTKLLKYGEVNQERAPINDLISSNMAAPLVPDEALQALHFILFELDSTGIVNRMPTNTKEPQSTWSNSITGMPILSVSQYLALRDLWESLQ